MYDPKIECMKIAATLAGAVLSNLPDELALDMTITDEKVRTENSMAWELQRIFYHVVVKAVSDDVNWPRPKLPEPAAGAPDGELLNRLVGLVPMLRGLLGGLAPTAAGGAAAPATPAP